MTTSERIKRYIEASCKVFSRRGDKWRSTSPLRPSSDSDTFAIEFDGDEHGTWYDHVSKRGGSLYELAVELGIELPEGRGAVTNTHVAYEGGLKQYAMMHGAPEEAFTAAGWYETTWGKDNVPALALPTQNGERYRLLDGSKSRWRNPVGYKKCWYGLTRAVKLATEYNSPIVLCNGEPSVVVAQYYNVPAVAVTSGEDAIPDELLKELRSVWSGGVVIAPDADKAGRAAAAAIRSQIENSVIVNMGLGESGDLADFCALHKEHSRKELLALTPKRMVAFEKGERFVDSELAQVISAMASPGEVRGFRSGFPRIDKNMSGWNRGDLHVILAATGMGKSTLITTMLPYLARQAPVAVDPTEMGTQAYMRKIACGMCGLNTEQVQDGNITAEQYVEYEKAFKWVAAAPIYFTKNRITSTEIVAEVEKAVEDYGISIFIADSMSNLDGDSPETYLKTVQAADALLGLCELNLCVITTAQTGRNAKNRQNKMPLLQDGQGGGRIEQNAAVVMGLYRHAYYVNIGEAEPHPDYGENTTLLTVLKHRHRDLQGNAFKLQMAGGSRFYEYTSLKESN